jgi:hypothetical protein
MTKKKLLMVSFLIKLKYFGINCCNLQLFYPMRQDFGITFWHRVSSSNLLNYCSLSIEIMMMTRHSITTEILENKNIYSSRSGVMSIDS